MYTLLVEAVLTRRRRRFQLVRHQLTPTHREHVGTATIQPLIVLVFPPVKVYLENGTVQLSTQYYNNDMNPNKSTTTNKNWNLESVYWKGEINKLWEVLLAFKVFFKVSLRKIFSIHPPPPYHSTTWGFKLIKKQGSYRFIKQVFQNNSRAESLFLQSTVKILMFLYNALKPKTDIS